jgi:cholesterol transport system auxiliary component
VGLLLPGCGLLQRAPTPVHTYLFSLDTLPDVAPAPVKQGTLLVAVPRARAGFNTPRMGYMLRPHELRYFATSQWADTPARMLAPLLVQVLEQSGQWEAVVQMPTVVQGEYRMELEHLALRHEFFAQPSQVRLQAHIQLIDLRRQCIMGARHFEVLAPAPSDDPYGGVLAANQAVTSLLQEVAGWLGSSVTGNSLCRQQRPATRRSRRTSGIKNDMTHSGIGHLH